MYGIFDLRTGIASVRYEWKGVCYTREYFNSYPDNILAIRYSADKKGAVSLSCSLKDCTGGDSPINTAEADTIIMRNTLKSNGMKTEVQLKVIPDGGRMETEGTSIHILEADSVTLILACGTDYKMELPHFRGEDPHEAVSMRLEKAASKGYEALKETHVKDHSNLFSRMELGFSEEIPQIPQMSFFKNTGICLKIMEGNIPQKKNRERLK